MKKYIFGLIIILASGFIQGYAQVTLGERVSPLDYSILQLEGTDKGLTLPQITTVQMSTLASDIVFTSNPKAAGLMAFNTDENLIVYWDGSRWVKMIHDLKGTNGINGNVADLKLGGNLIENTTIDQDGNSLFFDFDNNNSSSFSVNTTDLLVKEKSVDLKPSDKITINDKNLIQSDSVALNVDSLVVTGSKQALLLDNEGLETINTKLKLPSGSDQGNMLTIDPVTKNVSWQAIRPFSSVIRGSIQTQAVLGTGNVRVTDTLILPAGQWLIFAKINVYQNTYTQYLYNWIGLAVFDPSNPTTTTYYRLNGSTPEVKTRSANVFSYSTPHYTYYLNTPVDIGVFTYITSNNYSSGLNALVPATSNSNTWMGAPYFFAVRIDVPDE